MWVMKKRVVGGMYPKDPCYIANSQAEALEWVESQKPREGARLVRDWMGKQIPGIHHREAYLVYQEENNEWGEVAP